MDDENEISYGRQDLMEERKIEESNSRDQLPDLETLPVFKNKSQVSQNVSVDEGYPDDFEGQEDQL